MIWLARAFMVSALILLLFATYAPEQGLRGNEVQQALVCAALAVACILHSLLPRRS